MRIAIIGAGFTGLAAAYDLVKAGHEVVIYESEDHPGGLASGFREPEWNWTVEMFYHHWFASDRHVLGLVKELGWEDKVLFPRPLTVMYHQGKFYPFDSIMKALLFPGLGFGINKIRFGLVGLFLRITNDWKRLEHFTVHEWMKKWAGEKVYTMMWEPLVIGKFGEQYYQQVNMAWMWARLKARTTRLGTYEGGFQAFANQFTAHLQKMGVSIFFQHRVESIGRNNSKCYVDVNKTREWVDQVLVTLSPETTCKLVPTLPDEYLSSLRKLKSMGAVVMVLAMNHQLSREGYYWYNLPKSAGFPFLALVEHTNFVRKENFNNDHIIYMGDYLDPDHEYFQLSKEELLARFLPAIIKFNPQFNESWIRKSWLFKTSYAQPVPFINHSRNIPSIKSPISGIYFASMSQVYPWDRGTNFAVEIGRKAARLMMDDSNKILLTVRKFRNS